MLLTVAALCGYVVQPLPPLSPSRSSVAATRAAPALMKDYPTPGGLLTTDNAVEAAQLSQKFNAAAWQGEKKTVAIIGGGLSGLSCAKYLSDAGHQPLVLEARDVLGGKVSAWQDEDGDWIETGLHIFFGAYPNMMNLFSELGIEDRLQWKVHKMIFAMQELPGEFTTFDFVPGIPAPFNFGLAILLNQKMLTLQEKVQTAPPLLPMLIQGQEFIDAQDELSVLEFMRKYGMPERINEEVRISMAMEPWWPWNLSGHGTLVAIEPCWRPRWRPLTEPRCTPRGACIPPRPPLSDRPPDCMHGRRRSSSRWRRRSTSSTRTSCR